MTNARDTHQASGTASPTTDGTAAGPVPEANRPGHRPEVDQDKPFDKFAALAERAEGDADGAPSSRSGRAASLRTPLIALAVVVAAAFVLRTVLARRRTSRADQLVRTVRDTVVDTVDHVKGTVDHVIDAVGHVKDRLPG